MGMKRYKATDGKWAWKDESKSAAAVAQSSEKPKADSEAKPAVKANKVLRK